MKLAITQIVLGLFISIATAFVIVLDPSTFHIRIRLPGNGNFQTIFNPDLKEVVASCLTILLLLLGLAVLGFGIAQFVKRAIGQRSESLIPELERKNMQLATIEIVLGLLTTISAFLVVVWGFPTSYSYQLPGGENMLMFFTPGGDFVMAQRLSALVFLIGLAMLSCGIAQFLKARRRFRHAVKEGQGNRLLKGMVI
ncbi:MAG: hypothetical protein V1932_02550 [Chloroflexota bacterium]